MITMTPESTFSLSVEAVYYVLDPLTEPTALAGLALNTWAHIWTFPNTIKELHCACLISIRPSLGILSSSDVNNLCTYSGYSLFFKRAEH